MDLHRQESAVADAFCFTDDLGPAKVVHLTERRTGLRAIVVVDNVAAGPAIGGVRMAPEVTTTLCARLARAMTLKNAMAGLRHGGAKSGIVADPRVGAERKEGLVRAFASAISDLQEYIPGPDMGTDETTMALIFDEIGRAVGLPAELGGLPLDQLGATGFGVAASAEVAAERSGLDLDGATVAVQGYGHVGRHAARFLAERGCLLVGVADSRGAVAEPAGLDLDALDEIKAGGRPVSDHPGTRLERDSIVAVECDIWIPAAGPDILRADNADDLRARIVVQGANVPATDAAELRLHERGIVSVPDFVANAGGVICGAVELAGASRRQAFDRILGTVQANTAEVLDAAAERDAPEREVATAIAHQRVRAAMATRRWT